MKWLGESIFLALLILWTVVTLFGVDLTEANRNGNSTRSVSSGRGRGSAASRNTTRSSTGGRRRSGSRSRSRSRNRGTGSSRRRGSNNQASRGSRQNRRRGNRNNNRSRMSRFERYGCEEIYLPMCKGLVSYTHTKLPNKFNHTTQAEVFRHLETLTAYMDHSCSRNTRLLACATYLPKCHGRRPGQPPCKRTCDAARRKCRRPLERQLGLEWDERFACQGLTNRRCVRPMRDTRCRYEYPNCVDNQQISACQNLTFVWGTLPNMFGQCHIQDINLELRQYETLQATNCSNNLNFLLCGVHSPFCVHNDTPFTFPCRELCQQVRTSCESDYRRLNHNLPWPHKLQCHRYPLSNDTNFQCVMPNEGSTFAGGRK